MPRWDVQIHGAGWAGLAIARGLREAGVRVRVVDPAGAFGGASGRSIGLALPTHPEHPHRLEAGIGTANGRQLLEFVREGLTMLPGLEHTGVDWLLGDREAGEAEPALAAAARLGLAARAAPHGYHLLEGGAVALGTLATGLEGPVHPDLEDAEIDVYTTGAVAGDPWLEDKIMPVRWQVASFDGPVLPTPIVTQHATVRWTSTGNQLDACGARWATPHMEVGETAPVPEPRVTAMLERLTRLQFRTLGALRVVRAGIVGESCDGLPIVGPVPGRPRAVVCAGFGVAGLTYALPCARTVVDGLLGRPGRPLPAVLRVTRFA